MTPLIFAPDSGMDAALRLGVAALIGLAVGIEREWSGHARGPAARFAGLRTFFIMGLFAGIAGLLSSASRPVEGAVLLAGAVAFVVSAFVVTMRRPEAEVDGTTEAAALAVLGLAFLAGAGQLALASGAVAVIVLALSEKQRLHGLVEQVGAAELLAAARFAVMALVILPLLPAEPLPWGGGISPRGLWMLVLLFSAINFGGYIAHRVVGPDRGYGLAGLLGGLVSSTLVTLQFARRSREEPEHAAALALGTIGACTVLPIRLLAITAVLAPTVAQASLRYLIPPAVVGAGILLWAYRRTEKGGAGTAGSRSPLQVASSIKMAVAFLAALLAIDWLKAQWGATGVITSAILLGLTDMDALTVAMTRVASDDGAVALAAQGIAVGVISNTAFKLALAAALGSPTYRNRTALGLVALGAAVGLGLLGW